MASRAQEQGVAMPSRIGARRAWPDVAIMLVAFAIQVPLVLNADLGWLLTVCEKMLAGGRLGVDIIELNPPLSVLIYMPAAYLGTLLPIPAHIFVIVMVLILAKISANLTLAALSASEWNETARYRANLALLAVFTLVPGGTFAQREHIAVLAMVPFVALAASHAAGPQAPTPSWLRLATGIGGGFAMCIKPHFALLAAFPLLWAAYRRTSARPLFGAECWFAAFVVVTYFGTALLMFPDYFSVYPRWAAVAYLPLRMPASFFYNAGVLCSLAALAFMLHLTCGRDPAKWANTVPWLLAALGGFLSYVLQGKGFSYTRLPAVAFGLLAPLITPAFLSRNLSHADSRKIMLAGLALAIWLLPPRSNSSDLQQFIRAEAPAHPKLLMVASNGSVGEPLVRKVDGEWASAAGGQLLAGGAGFRLEGGNLNADDSALARQIIIMERDRLRDDLQQRRPDVLLIDSIRFGRPYDWEAWARADPEIARELDSNYRLAARKQGVAVWLRRRTDGAPGS
jgi:hypothetical protein